MLYIQLCQFSETIKNCSKSKKVCLSSADGNVSIECVGSRYKPLKRSLLSLLGDFCARSPSTPFSKHPDILSKNVKFCRVLLQTKGNIKM